MPTIEVKISDFESLLRRRINHAEMETLLERVKGEVKEFIPEQDTAKLELNDSNRPDLWSPEGIARQIALAESKKEYPFFDPKRKAGRKVLVSKGVQAVRPYVAAAVARGVVVTDTLLVQLIQSQEKLAEIFGRKRQTVSIGLYRLPKIVFPVRYDTADPKAVRFIPLGFEEPMSLEEILARHPKGIAYAHTLRGAARYPILIDADDRILSFPPIINSREIGEVQVGDSELFVEVTGTDQRMVTLALNIFACNLFDRGATIDPVAIHFPDNTEMGKVVRTPLDFSTRVDCPLDEFERVLGEATSVKEAVSSLESYGYAVVAKGKTLRATAPPYRDDTMHPVDVIEDFAISRGYGAFRPEMPSTFTVGSLSPLETFSDRLREEMIGFGFQEIVSNILGSRQEFIERMNIERLGEDGTSHERERPQSRLVEIENPMTERFSTLRASLLPSLLRVECAGSKAFYPHRIFEVGEAARLSLSGEETETSVFLAAMISHPAANFSELHAVLEAIFFNLSLKYRLESVSHPTFIEGRAGKIVAREREIGLIGEIHPEVLTRWQIGMPVAAFEFEVGPVGSPERPSSSGLFQK